MYGEWDSNPRRNNIPDRLKVYCSNQPCPRRVFVHPTGLEPAISTLKVCSVSQLRHGCISCTSGITTDTTVSSYVSFSTALLLIALFTRSFYFRDKGRI